jgi:ribosomal protein S18 acetylase RimI-like enzyme
MFMMTVELRKMTTEEYETWLPDAIAGYAAQHAETRSRPADRSLEMAEKEFAELLPDGLETDQQHLLVATSDGLRVGILWLMIPPSDQGPAFVFDIEVDLDLRGKGFGRATMLAAESYVRGHGNSTLRLHVFGGNTAARSLYESLGFETTDVMMTKQL